MTGELPPQDPPASPEKEAARRGSVEIVFSLIETLAIQGVAARLQATQDTANRLAYEILLSRGLPGEWTLDIDGSHTKGVAHPGRPASQPAPKA